jgi:hypothetical protein
MPIAPILRAALFKPSSLADPPFEAPGAHLFKTASGGSTHRELSLPALAFHVFGCQRASMPLAGAASTLRQPAGPSRGGSNTEEPS